MAKIYVGNLAWTTTEDRLREVFQQAGTVLDCIIMREQGGVRSRGFGFVTFGSQDEAERAIQRLNDVDVDGRKIRVNTATERPPGGGSAFAGGSYGNPFPGQFAAYNQFAPGTFDQYTQQGYGQPLQTMYTAQPGYGFPQQQGSGFASMGAPNGSVQYGQQSFAGYGTPMSAQQQQQQSGPQRSPILNQAAFPPPQTISYGNNAQQGQPGQSNLMY